MLEVDPFEGTKIFSFDGRVLEIFGHVSVIGAHLDAIRIHVSQLSVQISGHDKKGFRELRFIGPTTSAQLFRGVGETQLSSLRPLLDSLRAAGVNVAESESR